MSDDGFSTRTQGTSQRSVQPAGQKSIRKELQAIQNMRKLALFITERAGDLEDIDTTWINACITVDGYEVFRKPNGVLSVRKSKRSETKRIDELEARIADLEQKYMIIEQQQSISPVRVDPHGPNYIQFPEAGFG
jgi:chaperonin cofactor prefoldin